MRTSANSDQDEFRRLGPACGHPEELEWWDRHQGHGEDWLRGEVAAGLDPVRLGEFAASTLLGIPDARAIGRMPDEPDREPYTWDEIDAYEILFQQVVHGGAWEDWDPAEYLRLIGSFAKYLGERGIIAAAEHERLEEEYALWALRLLHVWAEGGWYLRDGTHYTQQEIERQHGETEGATMDPAAGRDSSSGARVRRANKRREQKKSRRRNR